MAKKGSNSISKTELPHESEYTKETLKKEFVLNQIIGNSKAIHELRGQIERISSCDATILITGESGTGKELAARAIHYLGRRAGNPFISVNCGAIPEGLFENEMFGHVKGAFTNAFFPQKGFVKEAEGGTLFLDEIGTMGPYVQVKLLRLLENKEFKPLGDSHTYTADIGIIAATNRDLLSLVREGAFREDLFYRLNIIPLRVPPLRERKEDIPILVEHFTHKYCGEYNRQGKTFSEDLVEVLLSYEWPGNVRELENKIQQLVVMATNDVIAPDDMQCPSIESPLHRTGPILKAAKREAMDIFEKKYLVNLLSEHRGNVVLAAKSSGKSRTALWNLLRKHQLSPKQFFHT
jgi:DNA-binding NtrC family response regulator